MKKNYISPSIYTEKIAVEPMLAGTAVGGEKPKDENPDNQEMFSKEHNNGLWDNEEE